jgi:lipopolysaccharide export system permease protein
MKIIHKYIGKTVIATTALVVLTLLGIELFIEFTKEFPELGVGSYGIVQVLSYVPLLLPYDIYQLFPMAGLLGCILGLGLLASHSELIVMRAAGTSYLKITYAVLKTALLLIIIMLVIGEVIAPYLQRIANENKTAELSNGQTIMTQGGIWLKNKNNFYHINKVIQDNKIQEVTKYVFNETNELKMASFAKTGNYINKKWIFADINQTIFDANSTKISHLDEEIWDMQFKPKMLGITSSNSEQKTLPELYAYIKYLKQSGLLATNYEFIFWQRIFQPIASLVMILLAVPFVLGPLKKVTIGVRILAGAIFGFVFFILNQFVGPISTVYQFPPILTASVPTLFFALLGIIMVLRLK